MGWMQALAIRALSVIVGASGGPQIIIASNGGVGTITITPGSTGFGGGVLEGGASGSPQFASMALIGPASTNPSHDDFMEETFNSANAAGTSTANIGWFYVDSTGTTNGLGSLNGTDWTMNVNLHVAGELFGTGGVLTIGDQLQVNNNAVITGTLSVNGSTSTGTAGLPNGTISGTSGAASAGTAHTHSGGSYAVTSGQHSHTL